MRAAVIDRFGDPSVFSIETVPVPRPNSREVLIALEGRTLHTVCLFGDAGDLNVLGAYTLEGFGLAVDPVQRKLIPALQYAATAA